MNEKLETINIKGKKYATVSTRVKHFREKYKGLKFDVNIVATDNDHQGVWIKAAIYEKNAKKDDIPISSGIAYEQKSASGVNSTNWTENCDTSAVGRALANLGIGIEDAYASANEVELALEKEKQNNAVNKSTTTAEKALVIPRGEKPADVKANTKLASAVKDREVYEDTVRTSGTEIEEGDEQKVVMEVGEPDALLTKDAPQEMIDDILGKKKNNGTEIGKKLVALNTKVMAIADTSEGSKLKKEYEEILAEHGEDNCPESLLKLVKESFYAASQRLNK